jgi:hypothetical protein
MQRCLTFLMVFFLLLSCKGEKEGSKVMSRNDFINLLVDIHIFDAYGTEHSLSSYINNVDSLSLYESIFQKYNTDDRSFQATMNHYSAKPEKLGEIYDEVFGKINRLSQEISDQLNLFSDPALKPIRNTQKYYLVRGDTAKYPEPFITNLPEQGKILITAQVRLLKDDESENPLVYGYIYKTEADDKPEDRLEIINFPMKKSNFSRDYQFVYDLNDKDYKYLHVQIPKVANKDSIFKKNLQISTFKVQYIPKEKPKTEELTDSLSTKK